MTDSKRNVSTATIQQIPLAEIVIGERRRQTLGRLKALAASINQHGLIHPILLRDRTLVSGHRRLEACRLLQWKTIPARQVDRMSDQELRAVELDENTIRENLSDFASSAARLAQIRQVEADLKATEFRSKPKRNSRRGRVGEGRPSREQGTLFSSQKESA